MPNLLAMSFEGELAPCFDLTRLRPGRKLPDGWGIGYYPGGEPSASVLKEPAPPQGSIRSELVKAWEHLESSLLVLHIRTATWGSVNDANTQPFSRSWGGRDWLFAHSGSLVDRIEVDPKSALPAGRLDGHGAHPVRAHALDGVGEPPEHRRHRSGGAARDWFDEMNEHGPPRRSWPTAAIWWSTRIAIAEGDAFLWEVCRRTRERLAFGDDDLEVDLTRRGVKSRKGVIVSSEELKVHGAGGLRPGSACRRGTSWCCGRGRSEPRRPRAPTGASRRRPRRRLSSRPVRRPVHAAVRRFQVVHRHVVPLRDRGGAQHAPPAG